MNIEDCVAVVTGGASGLGRATASLLAKRGAQVVIVDVQSAQGRQAAEEIGPLAIFEEADVQVPSQVDAALEVAEKLGPLRIVVNCAGVATPNRILRKGEPTALEDFAEVVSINLIGTFNVLRLSSARMARLEPEQGERGVIVNTASVAAFDGQIGQAAYASSKAGVAGLTLPAARDLAQFLIRVVAIAPGIFDTPMLAGLEEKARQSLGEQVPHPSRLGRPGEYAALVLHIIANPMLNGETIRLDGSLRMAPR